MLCLPRWLAALLDLPPPPEPDIADGLCCLAPPPACCGLRFAGICAGRDSGLEADWGVGMEAGLFGIDAGRDAGFDVGFA